MSLQQAESVSSELYPYSFASNCTLRSSDFEEKSTDFLVDFGFGLGLTGSFWEQLLGRCDGTVFFGGGVVGRESLRACKSSLFSNSVKTSKALLAVILLPGLFSQHDSMTLIHDREGFNVLSIS